MTMKCKNCPMQENCICIADSDECIIRRQAYNQSIDDVLEKLSGYDDVLKAIPASDLQGIICTIEQMKMED